MKILILHQHFKIPQRGGAIRSYYLAQALLEKGHQVCVVTGHDDKHFRKEFIDGIEVHYLPVAYNNRFGFAARSFSFLKYIAGVGKRANAFKNADLCYAISVPLTIGIAALWLKWRYNLPFIFEVGDLWPEAPIQMRVIKNPVFKSILYKLEEKIYREAKSVVALSPPIKEAIAQKVKGVTVHLIPNMADIDFFSENENQPLLAPKLSFEGKFVVSYIGALGLANGLDYFLECVRACEQAALPVQFLLCGEGAMLENLKHSAQRLQLQTITFVPFQNRDGVKGVLNVTDACFVCYKPVPVLETGSPNKYFDALAAGKLVVINFGGWIKAEIEEQRCGIYVDSKNPADFADKISAFITDKNLLTQYQRNGRVLAETTYSRKVLGVQFVSLFESGK